VEAITSLQNFADFGVARPIQFTKSLATVGPQRSRLARSDTASTPNVRPPFHNLLMGTVLAYTTADGKRYRVRYRTPDRRQTDKRGFTSKREAE
jgi:hypothetical protein